MTDLAPIEITTAPHPAASIIWLHGLGADGSDFVPIAQELGLGLPVRFIFPHAPVRPISLNGGYAMRGWYDIRNPDLTQDEDAEGITCAQKQLLHLIETECARGITPSRILLAGFSQGGAVALHTGIHHFPRIGGIIALSTYLPLIHAQPPGETAVFMAHGKEDTMIPIPTARASHAQLQRLGYPVDWHDYPMGHTVCPQEIVDIRQFILKCLTATPQLPK